MSRMTNTQRTVERIQRWARQSGLAKTRIAENAGLHRNALRHIFSPDWNPTRSTLDAVEKLVPPDFDSPVNGNEGEAA